MPHTHPYSLRVPWHQRRRVARLLLFATLLLVPLTAFYYGRPALTAAITGHRLHQAAIHAFPPETIIYSELPTDASLLSTGPYRAMVPVAEAPSRIVRNTPLAWPQLRERTTYIGSSPEGDALLFLHQLTAPSGESRIVAVTLLLKDTPTPEPTTRMALQVHILTAPARWTDAPIENYLDTEGQGVRKMNGEDDLDTAFTPGQLRFFAGRPDPANLARFTIRWEFNGVRHTLTGTLAPYTPDPSIPPSLRVRLQDVL